MRIVNDKKSESEGDQIGGKRDEEKGSEVKERARVNKIKER